MFFRMIPLTQGKFAKVSSKDFAELNQYRWFAIRMKRPDGTTLNWYAARNKVVDVGKRRTVYMHRQILEIKIGRKLLPFPQEHTDHKNGDGLDNLRSNLRLASPQQNSQNQTHKRQDCSSRYLGVNYEAKSNKWVAFIRDGARDPQTGSSMKRCLGRWPANLKGEKSAAKAYDDAASRSFGEFAKLNFPKKGKAR